MIIYFKRTLLLIIFLPYFVLADLPPDKLITRAVQQLIIELTERKTELEGDRAQLYELVDRVIVEHIAVERVAKLVLGKHWRDASVEQRSRFAYEFKNLLIRTYASALFDYTGGEKMTFRPLKIRGNERTIVVRTDIKLPGLSVIPVNYRFLRNNNSQWKIFDVTINGISLVTNYRSSYSQLIEREGLDALIRRLELKTEMSR